MACPASWVDINEKGLARLKQLEETSLEKSLVVISRMSRDSSDRDLVMVDRALQVQQITPAKV